MFGFSGDEPNIFFEEKLYKNGTLSISCVVHQRRHPSPLQKIVTGVGTTVLATFQRKKESRYSDQQEHLPRQHGQLFSKQSLVSFVAVQLNHTKCHRGRYWCDVTFLDMERFRWSLPAMPRVTKEIRTCGTTSLFVSLSVYVWGPTYIRL